MLDPDDRAAWLALLPHLGPGADAGPAVAFFHEHSEACLDELAAVPGHDAVRAGLVRLLPAVEADPDAREALLSGAERAARTVGVTDDEGGELVRRQPAWAGICLAEILAQRGSSAGLGEGLALARRGFSRGPGALPRGDGEVLWAMAEVSGDVGWNDLGDPLLDAALAAPFADAENRARVALVRVLRLLAAEVPATDAVDALLALGEIDDRTRTHALWIGAHLDREAGRLDRALARLEEAISTVDPDEDPSVTERLRSALAAWGGKGASPAEA